WKYTIDIIPVALVSQPTVNGIEVVQDPKHLFFPAVCGPTSCGITIGRRTTYGAGFAPIGFEFNFRRRHRVQPVAGINAGLLLFVSLFVAPLVSPLLSLLVSLLLSVLVVSDLSPLASDFPLSWPDFA